MFSWLNRLFGRKSPDPTPSSPEDDAAAEAFETAKQATLDKALGTMEDMVVHAIIPFFLGGGLDLYPFRNHIPGTLYATQELLHWRKDSRPKPSRDGYFELVAAFRDEEDTPPGTMPASASVASSILNPIARYASMANLNPGETMEIPRDQNEPNTCIVLDRLDLHGKTLSIAGESFFLLLVIQIHPSELAFARKESSAKLLERLKARGFYPYSDLDRNPVA